jgi:hypothetical protein
MQGSANLPSVRQSSFWISPSASILRTPHFGGLQTRSSAKPVKIVVPSPLIVVTYQLRLLDATNGARAANKCLPNWYVPACKRTSAFAYFNLWTVFTSDLIKVYGIKSETRHRRLYCYYDAFRRSAFKKGGFWLQVAKYLPADKASYSSPDSADFR